MNAIFTQQESSIASYAITSSQIIVVKKDEQAFIGEDLFVDHWLDYFFVVTT